MSIKSDGSPDKDYFGWILNVSRVPRPRRVVCYPCSSLHFPINRSSLRNQLYLAAFSYDVTDIRWGSSASKNHSKMAEGKGGMYKLGVKQPGWWVLRFLIGSLRISSSLSSWAYSCRPIFIDLHFNLPASCCMNWPHPHHHNRYLAFPSWTCVKSQTRASLVLWRAGRLH